MRKCLEKNPGLKNDPRFKGDGRDSLSNAFENALIMAAHKNKVNPRRLNVDEWWCIDGVIQDQNGNSIFYYDAERTNRPDLFDEEGKWLKWDVHVPIEKIDFFLQYPKSIYVRGNLEWVLILRREPIVEAFKDDKIKWDYNTQYGLRDLISVHTHSAISQNHLVTGRTVEWMKLVKKLMGLEYYWL
jgi:hypothetical protein